MINWPKRPSFILESITQLGVTQLGIAQMGTPKWVSADPISTPNGCRRVTKWGTRYPRWCRIDSLCADGYMKVCQMGDIMANAHNSAKVS